jgi:hypothetical protein
MDKGSIAMRLEHPDPDWQTNSKGYRFPVVTRGSIAMRAIKCPDRILEVRFVAEHFRHILGAPMPVPSPNGVHIVVEWKDDIVLIVNGERVQSATYRLAVH